jgi:guanylate kinase
VIAAPSGTGKTTLCRKLLDLDSRLQLSVSHTTRDERPGEREGVDYHFVTTTTFREMTDAGAFLEHAAYNRHLYGTSWAAIEGPLESGQDVLLEIEVQGADQVKQRRGDAVLIFLLPPSLEVLEKRLRGRGTDTEDAIQRRMALVDRELAAAPIFDFAIVNDSLDRAVDEVLEVIVAVREGRSEAVADAYGRGVVLARWHARQAGSAG